MDRRGFMGSILALAAAPAIVRADSLMRIVPRETALLPITYGMDWVRGPERIYTLREQWAPDAPLGPVAANGLILATPTLTEIRAALDFGVALRFVVGSIVHVNGKALTIVEIREP